MSELLEQAQEHWRTVQQSWAARGGLAASVKEPDSFTVEVAHTLDALSERVPQGTHEYLVMRHIVMFAYIREFQAYQKYAALQAPPDPEVSHLNIYPPNWNSTTWPDGLTSVLAKLSVPFGRLNPAALQRDQLEFSLLQEPDVVRYALWAKSAQLPGYTKKNREGYRARVFETSMSGQNQDPRCRLFARAVDSLAYIDWFVLYKHGLIPDAIAKERQASIVETQAQLLKSGHQLFLWEA